MMETGMFIVLDGNDGSGKATQARLLVERFTREDVPATKIDFPAYDRNLFGTLIGECLAGLRGDFVHLDPRIASSLYALDRLESSPTIRSLLEAGTVVVADRFTSSNQIHQGGKVGDPKERADFLAWLEKMEHEVLNIPRPSAVIYLDVPVEVSAALLEKKRAAKSQATGVGKDTVEKDETYLRQSHESARILADTQASWRIVSCTKDNQMRTPEDIHEEVWGIVSSL